MSQIVFRGGQWFIPPKKMLVTTSVAGTNSIMNRKAWDLNIEVTSENGAANEWAAPMSANAEMT